MNWDTLDPLVRYDVPPDAGCLVVEFDDLYAILQELFDEDTDTREV